MTATDGGSPWGDGRLGWRDEAVSLRGMLVERQVHMLCYGIAQFGRSVRGAERRERDDKRGTSMQVPCMKPFADPPPEPDARSLWKYPRPGLTPGRSGHSLLQPKRILRGKSFRWDEKWLPKMRVGEDKEICNYSISFLTCDCGTVGPFPRFPL